MSLTYTVMLMLPSFSLGAVLMGSIGLPLAYRRGRARTEDEARLFEGVALARDHHKPLAIAAEPALHPLVEETLPAQFGTRAEHDRRAQIAEASQIPIGAEPADGRSGLTSPAAAGAAVTAARTSGNAAPPLDAQPPPRTGGPAGSTPKSLRELDRYLVMHDEAVTVTLGWRDYATDLWERLDRLASNPRLDPLCAWLGRRERHWWHDYATGAHATLVPYARPAAKILARLAIERETGLLPILAEHGKAKGGFVKPGPFYVGEPPPIDVAAYTDDEVTAPALLGPTDEGPIPVAHIGAELVEVAT